jgi:hypothetical protein
MMPVNIFFTGGMFGSTLEYMLRQFTIDYYSPVDNSVILTNGSAHNFQKELHLSKNSDELIECIEESNYSISTVVPTPEDSLTTITNNIQGIIKNHNNILIYADSLQDAELNMLFQYYKITKGSFNDGESNLLFNNPTTEDFSNWNSSYTRWQDLSRWELREWFSLFYEGMLATQLNSTVPDNCNFLTITNMQLLTNLKNTFFKVCNHFNLNIINQRQLESFVVTWREAQHYIILKYQIIDLILAHIVNYTEKSTFWWTNLDIIQEAIIQKRLRDLGYELRCDGLNKFPNDIKSLYNLLEVC